MTTKNKQFDKFPGLAELDSPAQRVYWLDKILQALDRP
jgi:hypothetical protein